VGDRPGLADQVAALERADWAVVCGSGMAAISAALLTVVKQGDRIVASNIRGTRYGSDRTFTTP